MKLHFDEMLNSIIKLKFKISEKIKLLLFHIVIMEKINDEISKEIDPFYQIYNSDDAIFISENLIKKRCHKKFKFRRISIYF